MECKSLCLAMAAALAVPLWAASTEETDKLAREVIDGAKNDADRAAKLLAAARVVHEQPEVMVALLEKAVDYGLRGGRLPGSLAAADQALDLLDRSAPVKKPEWEDQRLTVHRLRYRNARSADKRQAAHELFEALLRRGEQLEEAGEWGRAARVFYEAYPLATLLKSLQKDEINYRRLRAGYFDRVAGQVDQLKKSLAADPGRSQDRARLLSLLVAELGEPAEAAKYLTGDVDPAWRTYLPMALKDPNTLGEAAAIELGRWYHEFLAPKASKYAKEDVLLDARDCYARAIELHAAKDTQLAALKVTLGQIDTELDRLAEAAGRGTVVDLLKLIDFRRDVLSGLWAPGRSGLLAQRGGDSRLKLPAILTGDYELSIKFLLGRGRAGTGVQVAVPAGSTHTSVVVGGGRDGTTAGLDRVDRKDLHGRAGDANPTRTQISPLGVGRLHELSISVSAKGELASVTVELDRKEITRWRGKPSSLSLGPAWGTVSEGALLLRVEPPATFPAIRLRAIRGKAELLPPPRQPARVPTPVPARVGRWIDRFRGRRAGRTRR